MHSIYTFNTLCNSDDQPAAVCGILPDGTFHVEMLSEPTYAYAVTEGRCLFDCEPDEATMKAWQAEG